MVYAAFAAPADNGLATYGPRDSKLLSAETELNDKMAKLAASEAALSEREAAVAR